jgi:hypothetical protein
VLGLTVAALSLTAPAAAQPHARIALRDGSPDVIRGTAFHPHERVTLHVHPGRGRWFTRHVTASASGTFSAPLNRTSTPPCGGFTATAVGSLGSRAQLPGLMFPDCIVS